MITGAMFRDGILSASNNISNNRAAVDALNIFPVPDGDTGTNMSMTIGAAAKDIAALADDCTIETAAKTAAASMLRGARGNSGVILSLIFRGISKSFKGMETAGAQDVAAAFRAGTNAAYKAVMKPTEGTILTVIRVIAEKLREYLVEVIYGSCAHAHYLKPEGSKPSIIQMHQSRIALDSGIALHEYHAVASRIIEEYRGMEAHHLVEEPPPRIWLALYEIDIIMYEGYAWEAVYELLPVGYLLTIEHYLPLPIGKGGGYTLHLAVLILEISGKREPCLIMPYSLPEMAGPER